MPRIIVGNHYLEWDARSGGLPQDEIPQFKHFVSQTVPYLTPVLFETIKGCDRLFERSGKAKSHNITDALSPRIMVSRKFDNVTYRLEMDKDGKTVLSRTEQLSAPGPSRLSAEMCVEWKLGELLFDRQGLNRGH